MSYSLGLVPATITPFDKGASVSAGDSREAARWFLITPDIERVLRDIPATYGMIGGERGVQYMGISPSGTQFYTKSATGGGSSSGSTKLSIPAGAQVISYAEVLSALAPVAQRTSAPAGTSSKRGLYIGLAVAGGLALVGGGIYLMTRKKAAPVALAKNALKRAGFTTKRQARLDLDAAVAEYMKHSRGFTPAEARRHVKSLRAESRRESEGPLVATRTSDFYDLPLETREELAEGLGLSVERPATHTCGIDGETGSCIACREQFDRHSR